MTEVPEHLLARSRERREALGLATGEGGGAPAAPAEASPAPAGDEGQPSAAPVPAAAAAPAIPAEPSKPQLPAYVAELRRTRVPLWVMPVLVLLPLWGFLYVGAFASHKVEEERTPMQIGADVYRSAGCGACHGANGEGNSGPALAGGEVELTFPDEEAHKDWVRTGSQGKQGQPYGDPDREGGQRVAATGQMPAFAGTLSSEEIDAVVLYEREGL